jgi:hypothetical protein
MEKLMMRAEVLLCYLTEAEVAKIMVENGEKPAEVFFALKAARILLNDTDAAKTQH